MRKSENQTELAPPIEETIRPLIAELEQFLQTISPNIIGENRSIYFEKTFRRLGTVNIRIWLENNQLMDSADQFAKYLATFLVKLRHWEKHLRAAQIDTIEEWLLLTDYDLNTYYAFKHELEDIVDHAEKTLGFLKELSAISLKKI